MSLYSQMAEIWEEKFDKPDRAIDALQKILLIDARNQAAYRDLERLYRAEKRWDALADNYRNHILVVEDPDERTELYVRMGKVYEEELKDPERAIEAYNDVLSFEPSHVEALKGLARLYEETDQWEKAEVSMRSLLPLVDDKEQGRPQLPPRQDLRRAHALTGHRRGAAGSRRCRSTRPTCPACWRCWACTSGGATR